MCAYDVLFRVSDPFFQEQCKGIIVRLGGPVKVNSSMIYRGMCIANQERDVLHCT
jgi:hypothetical protein